MIIRLTAKLAKRLHFPLQQALPAHENPYLDWTATVFSADRAQYVMLINSKSLFSVVFYAKGLTSDDRFVRKTEQTLRDNLSSAGFAFPFQRFIEPELMRVTFCKNANRSVTGSMNDLIYQAKCHIIEGNASPADLSILLNRIPMGALKYECPYVQFPKMLPR